MQQIIKIFEQFEYILNSAANKNKRPDHPKNEFYIEKDKFGCTINVESFRALFFHVTVEGAPLLHFARNYDMNCNYLKSRHYFLWNDGKFIQICSVINICNNNNLYQYFERILALRSKSISF